MSLPNVDKHAGTNRSFHWCLSDALSADKWSPSEIHNMSSRGVYLVTSHPVFVGLTVQVLLRMPRWIAGTLERVFTGQVSHIEWNKVPSGTSGVGVEFFPWGIPKRAVQ